MLSFEQALQTVRVKLSAERPTPATESVELLAVRGRVLAEDVTF